MNKLVLPIKAFTLGLFGIFATLSLMHFPFLIGSSNSNDSIIGYSYLALLLISISVIYKIAKKI